MWIEGNLLLLASSWVHQWVRVEIAALCVVVSDRNTGSKSNIGRDVTHALRVEGRLELGAHESITLARVDKAKEVDVEHSHVESDWDDDEAEDSGEKVLGVESWGDVLVVTKQNPKLDDCQTSDPGNCEKADPFDAGSGTQSNTSHDKPEPPVWLECLGWSLLVLVCKRREGESSECSHDHERRVEKDEASLSKQTVLCITVSGSKCQARLTTYQR